MKYRLNFAVELNYAKSKTTSYSSSYGADFSSDEAVDGDVSRGNLALTEEIANQWWKVDLQETIILMYAKIFTQEGNCPDQNIRTLPCRKNIKIS